MKRFLLPLLAAFALPTAVSSETWISIGKSKSISHYIDASSVVKNGYKRYANIKYKRPYITNEGVIRADCNEKQYRVLIGTSGGYSLDLIYKRKSKDYWVSVLGNDEIKMNSIKPHEGIYQFLCKEWE